VGNTRVLVGLMFRRGAQDGLYAAAFDRATLRPRWVAGPFPSARVAQGAARYDDRYRLVVKDERVVVADAAGTARVLDLATGAERGTATFRRGVEGACIEEGGAHRIVLGLGAHTAKNDIPSMFPWELYATQPFVLDPVSLRVTPTAHGTLCSESNYCTKVRTDMCQELGETDRPPKERTPERQLWQVWRDGDRRVAVSPGESGPIILGWNAKTEGESWEAPISWMLDENRPASRGRAAMTERAFFYGNLTRQGPYEVAGFDTKTGRRLFVRDVRGSGRGSDVPVLAADGRDLFVTIDDQLVVLDAESGVERGRLEAP
jgi:hypothetical protein